MGFDPQECLVIEDSIPGIQAAISGGFDVLIYANEVKKKKINLLESKQVEALLRIQYCKPIKKFGSL